MSRSRNLLYNVVNLFKPGVTRGEIDRSARVILDGAQNRFPDYLIKIVSLSPTASTCMDRRKAFVAGTAFVDRDAGGFPVNDGETLDDFHDKVASDFAFFDRLAIKIRPNRGGGIDSLHHLPVEWVRWAQPDQETQEVTEVYVNPFINTAEEKKHKRYYPVWRMGMDTAQIRKDIARYGADYDGHVFFFNKTNQRNRNYSRPVYFSAEDYIKVDSKIGLFHNRNIDNNFFLGGILTMFGDPGQGVVDPVTGDTYSTVGEEFESQLSESFSGAEEAGSVLVVWVQDKEQVPSLEPWQANTNHELFTAVDDKAENKIAMSFLIPKILLGQPTAGKLGQANEIRDAILFANQMTQKNRNILTKVYNGLTELDCEILPVQDFTDLTDSVFGSLGLRQKADYLKKQYGIEPEENTVIEPITISPNGR